MVSLLTGGRHLMAFIVMRCLLVVSILDLSRGVREGWWFGKSLTDTVADLVGVGKTRAQTHLYLNYSARSTKVLADYSRCSLPVVSVAEAEKFISALGQIPSDQKRRSRTKKQFDFQTIQAQSVTYEEAEEHPDFDFSSHEVEVSYQTRMTVHFALLSSARWRREQGAFLAVYTNKETEQEEIIEIELNDGAHGVLYMYRLSLGGIGVVLTMKGSSFTLDCTAVWDWLTNLRTGLSADDDSGLEGGVHNGYRLHRKRLLALMGRTSLEEIRPLLEEWGGKEVAEDNLKDWFYNGDNWEWVFFSGQSMGAGMAQIEAAALAARLGIKEADHRVFLGHVESPKIGSEEFVRFAEEHVSPHGGLNVEKLNDIVPHVGSSGGSSTGMRVSPAPGRLSWALEHAFFHIPATVNGERGIVRFSTLCAGARGVSCTSGCSSQGCRRDEPNSDIWMNDRVKYDVRTAELH